MHPPSQPGTVVSVAKIDMSLPQSGRQAYGQEMTSAVPVAMETRGREGMGMGHLAWGLEAAPRDHDILQATAQRKNE